MFSLRKSNKPWALIYAYIYISWFQLRSLHSTALFTVVADILFKNYDVIVNMRRRN
jgi:hypothetical protein